jgi:hypothetical protein
MPNRRRIQKSLRTELDFTLENHGCLFLLHPLTTLAREWMNEHLPVENPETQFFAGAIVVEPRYIGPIVKGIVADSMTPHEEDRKNGSIEFTSAFDWSAVGTAPHQQTTMSVNTPLAIALDGLKCGRFTN